MKKRLLTVTGFVALIAIVSLIAFNAGERSGAESTLATSNMVGDTGEVPAVSEPIAQESTAPEVEDPVEVAQLEVAQYGTAAELEAETVSSNADPSRVPQEGIKVHGKWKIDVTEPDGKLVSHHEFDNSLEHFGIDSLTSFLDRSSAIGRWSIRIASPANLASTCLTLLGAQADCYIYEDLNASNFVAGATQTFPDLSVTGIYPTTGGYIVLSGAATVANDTTISIVSTQLQRCGGNFAPDDVATCTGSYLLFTSKTLAIADQVPVLPGQVVNVTVEISFS
jgi:hypothetical protein